MARQLPKSPFLSALGMAIRLVRVEHEMTQMELGDRSGLHPTWISHIEGGRINPTADNLLRLSKGLGVTLSGLIARSEELEGRFQPEAPTPMDPGSR